jgi:predicted metal-dependent hydrolase
MRGLIQIKDNRLIIPGSPENSRTKIKKFLSRYLLENIQCQAELFTSQIHKTYKNIIIGNFKSKWGSCSADASLSFDIKLVFAPRSVLLYVIAHEVAHLAEMNHSPRFWRIVEQLQPGYAVHRRWLKHNSHLLKRYIL